jgi:hypothetical protein
VLFIVPPPNQLEDHFVRSSALPLNSSSNTNFQLPPTPNGPAEVAGVVGTVGGGVVGGVGVVVGGAGVVGGVVGGVEAGGGLNRFGLVELVCPVEPVGVVVGGFGVLGVVGVVGVVEAGGVVTVLNRVGAVEVVGVVVPLGVVEAVGAAEALGAAGLGEAVPCGAPPLGRAGASGVRRRIETPTVGRLRRPKARTVMEPPVTEIRTETRAFCRFPVVVAYRSSEPILSLIRLRMLVWLERATWTA